MNEIYKKEAVIVAQTIRELASNPDNLDNLESYLSMHFGEWLKRFANSPENMAAELKNFARMNIQGRLV